MRYDRIYSRALLGLTAVSIVGAGLYVEISASLGAAKDERVEVAQAGGDAKPPASERDGSASKRAQSKPRSRSTAADEAPRAADPAPRGSAAPTPAAGGTPFTPTAMQHATSARMSRCVPLIGQATQFTAGAPNATLSQWSQDRPDDHMFQALIGLGGGAQAAPKSAAILVASPEGRGCEATVVQIQPTPRSCSDIEADLRRNGAKLAELSGMAVVQGSGTAREMLVPVPNAGCVVVGTGLALNK